MKRILVTIGSFLLILFFSNIIITGFCLIFVSADTMTTGLGVMTVYGSSMGLTTLLLVLLKKALNLSISTLSPRIDKINLPLVLLGLLLVVISGIALDPILQLFSESSLDSLYDMMRSGIFAIVTSVLLAPIFEEYIFRGVLQRSLIAQSKPWVGILLTSIIFGAIHIIPQQMVSALVAGLILGTIFRITGSLTTVVMIHLLNNGLAYLQFLYLGSDLDPISIIFPTTLSYSLAVSISAVVIIVFGIIGVRKIEKI